MNIASQFQKEVIVRLRHTPQMRQFSWRFRTATKKWRTLPDFLIVGAQKAGTRSLFTYLAQHPNIIPPYRAEIHFFDGGMDPTVDNYAQGLDWYRAHFPLNEEKRDHSLSFEKSPLYLFNPLTPSRIHGILPNVKILVLLRNPRERAISHYFHEKRKGREPLSMLDAFRAEEDRLRNVLAEGNYKDPKYRNWSYKGRGLYGEQIKRYLDLFPREHIKIIDSNSFFKKTEETLEQIFSFLSIDPRYAVRDLRVRNKGQDERNIPENIVSYLDDFFYQPNQKLYELVDKDFGW
jgi:hypothetical protein